MTACVNSYEEAFLGKLDRRIGARTSGSSTFVPKYDGATVRNVWRRSDALVEAPKATPAPRPVAPVVKKAAPVVAKAMEVEAEVPVTPVVEAPMPTLTELWEAEQEAKERRSAELEELRKRFNEKPAATKAVKPPEDFTWTFDLSRPKLKKPPKKVKKAKAKRPVVVTFNLREWMLEKIDQLHPEVCQAATTMLGAYKPSEIYWTTAAFRTAVERADDGMLREMNWRFLDLARALSQNIEERAAK